MNEEPSSNRPEAGSNRFPEDEDDVAHEASLARHAEEADSIDESLSSDRESVREELYATSTARQVSAASHDREVKFGRQMIQLALIPAIIVAGVMGVWLLIVSLTGKSQSLEAVLQSIEDAPVMQGGGAIVDVPGRQQAFRDAMTLAAILAEHNLTQDQHDDVRDRLTAVARAHMGADPRFLAFVMKAIGVLHDPTTLPLFGDMLESTEAGDQTAAIQGLFAWQSEGDITAIRPLTYQLVDVLLNSQQMESRTLAALLLGGAADPADMQARNALARIIDQASPDNRELAWNAGCALAALGDERGIPVVLSLLDRDWLARQPDPENPKISLTPASQDKMIKTVLNILVRFVPDENGGGHYVVRVDNERVWRQVENLASNDPSEEVRAVAQQVLNVRTNG